MPIIDERFDALGITLPAARKPAFVYMAVAVHGGLAYVSGQLPWLDEEQVVSGVVGADCTATNPNNLTLAVKTVPPLTPSCGPGNSAVSPTQPEPSDLP